MIKFKIDRDQARLIQQDFFPFMERWLATQFDNARGKKEERWSVLIVHDLLLEVMQQFNKRLSSAQQRFTIRFNNAQAVILYRLLIILPISAEKHYHNLVRQTVIAILDKELI